MEREEKVQDKETPSSAPFGGTFPLVGGRLGRAADSCPYAPMNAIGAGVPNGTWMRRVREAAPYRVRKSSGRAATWGRPYGIIRTSTVGSAEPGAVVEPHSP